MSSTNPADAIIPTDLGTAGAFDQSLLPLEYAGQEGDLNKGSFLIRATLEELAKIRELGIDLNNLDFIFDTRLNYDTLKAEEEKLQDDRRLGSLNPAARLFHAEARTLFLQTKRRSIEMLG
ncbi:hypothetical protein L210DRAFT_3766173 [Boletus edulis BED1]|uniref:Uncharacterized protein n=1 Tax=Boletus edulis BED1 TaxID=1328754 RepID=A0AAD4BCV3_BOLED|nr:hypothetical protein L210DRAFT_3766173 [Boletus edulis BED1]